MEQNGMFDEERIDINMADEGKAYNEGFDDGFIKAMDFAHAVICKYNEAIIGHNYEQIHKALTEEQKRITGK